MKERKSWLGRIVQEPENEWEAKYLQGGYAPPRNSGDMDAALVILGFIAIIGIFAWGFIQPCHVEFSGKFVGNIDLNSNAIEDNKYGDMKITSLDGTIKADAPYCGLVVWAANQRGAFR